MGYWKITLFSCLVLTAQLVLGRPRNPSNTRMPAMGARIINGTHAKLHEVPYQVLVRVFGDTTLYCGGALINGSNIGYEGNDFVITASHCVSSSLDSITVSGGILDRYDNDPVLRRVVEIYFYEKKYSQNIENDIALLKLEHPFPRESKSIKGIQISKKRPNPGDKCIASGWGDTDVTSYSDVRKLNVLEVPIIEQKLCDESYPAIQVDRFCAGYMSGGLDTCQGDSGGPLACNGVLVGIIEGGEGCARPGKPGTYTNVSFYQHWIESVLTGKVEPNKLLFNSEESTFTDNEYEDNTIEDIGDSAKDPDDPSCPDKGLDLADAFPTLYNLPGNGQSDEEDDVFPILNNLPGNGPNVNEDDVDGGWELDNDVLHFVKLNNPIFSRENKTSDNYPISYNPCPNHVVPEIRVRNGTDLLNIIINIRITTEPEKKKRRL